MRAPVVLCDLSLLGYLCALAERWLVHGGSVEADCGVGRVWLRVEPVGQRPLAFAMSRRDFVEGYREWVAGDGAADERPG